MVNSRGQKPALPGLTRRSFPRSAAAALFLLFLQATLWAAPPPSPFDLVIINGHIIDGTGSPWYSADLGIRGGKIAAIGNLSESPRGRTIDAHGLAVAPGFIDMLGQSEKTILVDPRLPSKIFQGITTEITGEGDSAAPLNDFIIQADRGKYEHYRIMPDWRTFRQYFARLEKQGIGINLASYVGATQVRRMILGDDDKQPSPEQLEQMKELVRQAMKEGAVGVSTALEYTPAPYAKTEELIALASEGSKFGGIYATHMRNESDAVLPAIDEALRIGQEAHIPVEIWHIKVAGKANWGRMPEVVAKINAARAEGVDVAADTYAYTAWYNDFSAFIPQWAHDGGNAKLVETFEGSCDASAHSQRDGDALASLGQRVAGDSRAGSGPDRLWCTVQSCCRLQGKTLAEVAKIWNKDPMDALFDLLIQDHALTEGRCLRYVRARRCSGTAAALGVDQQRLLRHGAGRNSRPGASSSAGLRNLSPYFAQVCSRGEASDAGRCDSQVFRFPGPAYAAGRPRCSEGGDVGRCGRI